MDIKALEAQVSLWDRGEAQIVELKQQQAGSTAELNRLLHGADPGDRDQVNQIGFERDRIAIIDNRVLQLEDAKPGIAARALAEIESIRIAVARRLTAERADARARGAKLLAPLLVPSGFGDAEAGAGWLMDEALKTRMVKLPVVGLFNAVDMQARRASDNQADPEIVIECARQIVRAAKEGK